MKVVYDLRGGYPDDIDHYLKYHEMGDDSDSNVMFFGYNAINNIGKLPSQENSLVHFYQGNKT
jgi:hypothetical protein